MREIDKRMITDEAPRCLDRCADMQIKQIGTGNMCSDTLAAHAA